MAIKLDIPDFVRDPLFESSQEKLSGVGRGILAGDLPDFYASLGKTGSPEFESMLKMINRDTARAVSENLVRRNIARGGLGASVTAKAMADVGTTLRWSDFLRASREKVGLLETGLKTVSGVRGAAAGIGGQENVYNVQRAQLDLKAQEIQAKLEAAKEAAKNKMWTDIISSGIGAAGMAFGLPGLGAIAGAAGSALSGGGVTKSASVLNPGISSWNLAGINKLKSYGG